MNCIYKGRRSVSSAGMPVILCLNGYDKRLYLHIHTDGINYSADNTAKEGNI